MPNNLTASVVIDAATDEVWRVVSDLGRMGNWSPQCRKVIVLGKGVRLGTRMININRMGWKAWPTHSKVVRYEPNSQIAFRVRDNGSIWSYRLESLSEGGTLVTETRDVSAGIKPTSSFLTKHFLGGNQQFEVELVRGMELTLARMKADVEAAEAH
ncbi:SRPBCC family protein [Calidifontibacter terrae]